MLQSFRRITIAAVRQTLPPESAKSPRVGKSAAFHAVGRENTSLVFRRLSGKLVSVVPIGTTRNGDFAVNFRHLDGTVIAYLF